MPSPGDEDAVASPVQGMNMNGNRGGRDAAVPEQLLDDPITVTAFPEMVCEETARRSFGSWCRYSSTVVAARFTMLDLRGHLGCPSRESSQIAQTQYPVEPGRPRYDNANGIVLGPTTIGQWYTSLRR
jgi:hypothetical protein